MDKQTECKRIFLSLSAIFLPVSVGFIAVMVTLMMVLNRQLFPFIVPLISLVSSVLLGWAGMQYGNRVRFHFAACFLFLTGSLLLLLDLGWITIPLPGIWPFLMLFVGCSFMYSGYLKKRQLHPSYIVPAIAFTGLGFVFLLFSTEIITVSFISVALWWFPLLLLPTGISVLIWLFHRNKKPDNIDE